jgi:hypothetical protein
LQRFHIVITGGKNDFRTQRKYQGTVPESRTIERLSLTLPKKKKG